MNKIAVFHKEVSFVSDDLRVFGRMVRKLLNFNFSNLTDEQKAKIRELEKDGKVFLTYPVNPFAGEKWLEIKGEKLEAERWHRPWEEGDLFQTLTFEGQFREEYVPITDEYQDGYWDSQSNYELGHQLVEVTHDLILRNPTFVAESGYGVTTELQDGSYKYKAATIRVVVEYIPDRGIYSAKAEVDSPVPGYYWKAFNRAARELCID